ncbi:hypothetical protein DFJ68_1348 [Terracoccus luteus]|uniref:Lipoprotein n=1 Tax=Terracoccus luteus TaxID=53356 RepID=A0A495XXM9_9MICO|nr:hypothetical protein [Terracoccus luteus]RKT77915.1 hypothetical protein DFJ68_1348 [Terracoccus luteus]
MPALHRTRSAVVAVTTGALLALAACSSATGTGAPAPGAPGSSSQSQDATGATGSGAPATPTTSAPPQLPGGGRSLLPEYRLVGYAGVPGSKAMGRLGIGDLDERAAELKRVGTAYADGRKVMPVLELIATIVQGRPGADGKYRSRVKASVVDDYLAAARRVGGIMLINIQPGRADFLDEVEHYEPWLEQPDVGIALDPEWAMGPGEVPMKVFGHTTGKEIDAVAAYLSGVVAKHDLPEKALVFHQLSPSIVRDEDDIRTHQGVVVIKSVDGIGSPGAKTSTWKRLTKDLPTSVEPGFKLFYEEDGEFGPIMTPKQVLALRPKPDYVLYE